MPLGESLVEIPKELYCWLHASEVLCLSERALFVSSLKVKKAKTVGERLFLLKDVVLAQKRCFEWDFLSSLRFADVAARS